jgi:aminoglycoside N3'-acetyltransferase
VVADLRDLGVNMGDVVMVHASLRGIGPVVGGADGVVSALETAVGSLGTVVTILGAVDGFDWVNGRPEEERPTLPSLPRSRETA